LIEALVGGITIRKKVNGFSCYRLVATTKDTGKPNDIEDDEEEPRSPIKKVH